MGWTKASRPVPGPILEVQVRPKMSVRGQITQNGSDRAQHRRFGLRFGPEACQDRSGAFRTDPAAPKNKEVCPSRRRPIWLAPPEVKCGFAKKGGRAGSPPNLSHLSTGPGPAQPPFYRQPPGAARPPKPLHFYRWGFGRPGSPKSLTSTWARIGGPLWYPSNLTASQHAVWGLS